MTPAMLGFTAWGGLLLLHLSWYLWLAPPLGSSPGMAVAVTLTPLLLPLLALRNSAQRALLWLGVLSLFYFSHGIMVAWGEPRVRLLGLVEVLLCVLLIGALGWSARGYKRPPKA